MTDPRRRSRRHEGKAGGGGGYARASISCKPILPDRVALPSYAPVPAADRAAGQPRNLQLLVENRDARQVGLTKAHPNCGLRSRPGRTAKALGHIARRSESSSREERA